MKSSKLEYAEEIPVFNIRTSSGMPWDHLYTHSDLRSAAEIRVESPIITMYLYAPKPTSDHPQSFVSFDPPFLSPAMSFKRSPGWKIYKE